MHGTSDCLGCFMAHFIHNWSLLRCWTNLSQAQQLSAQIVPFINVCLNVTTEQYGKFKTIPPC